MFRLSLAFLAALGVTGQDALAQTIPVDNGWRIDCVEAKCEMSATRALSGKVISRLLIYKVGKKTLLEYLVPMGVNLQKGIILQVDDKYSFPTQALYCDAPGCVGYAILTTALLQRLKKGRQLKVAFSPHNDSRYFAFDYSLAEFATRYATFVTGKEQPAGPSAQATDDK